MPSQRVRRVFRGVLKPLFGSSYHRLTRFYMALTDTLA